MISELKSATVNSTVPALNEETPEFREAVPTTENLAREIYRRLKGFPAARLERVLTTDPAMGVLRHADAGYEEAMLCARAHVPAAFAG